MRSIILAIFVSVFFMTDGHAQADMSCRGSAWLKSPWFPLPLRRQMSVHVHFTTSDSGVISSNAGGGTLTYEGHLILDGSKEMIVTEESGDDIRFFAKVVGKKMKFKLSFYSPDGAYQGGTSLATLRCSDQD